MLYFWIGALGYTVAFLYGLASVSLRRRPVQGLMSGLIAASWLVQFGGLYQRGLMEGGCPVTNPFEILQFIAWSMVLIYGIVGPAFRMSLLGFFTAGLAATISLVSLFVPAWDRGFERNLFGGDAWLETHAALSLFSYGVFALLALTSLMFLLQNYSLKHKRFEGFFTLLPSIRELEQVNGRLLTIAASVFSIAAVLGVAYWAARAESITAFKLVFVVLVWIGYAGTLALRLRKKLYGQRLAWVCILLFAVALLALWPVDANRDHLVAAALSFVF